MKSFSLRREHAVAAALLFLAGCSGASSPTAPTPQNPAGSLSSSRAPAGYRFVPGPVVAGPQRVSTAHDNGAGYIERGASTQEIGFIADANNNQIDMYGRTGKIGVITQGVDCPDGLAVDNAGTLYIANACNNTITEYPLGQVSPDFTITGGLNSPYGLAVDSNGNVFASNLGNNTVTGYKAGQSSPFETVTFPVGAQPVGVGVDASNDVYVASDSSNTIFIIPAGSSTAQNSGITSLNGPIGVSFNASDTLYVSNFAANDVAIYPSGSTSPTGTITDGIVQPTLNGFAKPGLFFQSDQTGPVVGYKPGQTAPFVTIHGIARPLGIASYPRVNP